MQFDTSTLVSQVTSQLTQLDDYDEPCFFLLYTDDSPTEFYDKLKQLSEQLQYDIGPIKSLGEHLYFRSILMDTNELKQLTKQLESSWKNEQFKISIFRHNPIGNPIKTFKWTIQQLQAIEDNAGNGIQIAINDYQDRDNWPGIDQYVACSRKQERQKALFGTQDDAQEQTTGLFGKIKSWLTGYSEQTTTVDSPEISPWLKAAQNKLSFPLGNGFLEVAPFIYSLPQGEVLWYYVLTGENREQLDATNGLLDLDHILIFHHAKKFAPELCEKMLSACYGLSTQNELFEDLDEVLDELTDELLDDGEHLAQRQACYLRILDIFYHLFDQQLPEAFYELLVKDEEKACLSQQQYQQRYPIVSIATSKAR